MNMFALEMLLNVSIKIFQFKAILIKKESFLASNMMKHKGETASNWGVIMFQYT